MLSHPDRDHYSAFELLGCAYRIAELLHASNEEAESVVKDLRAKLDHECPEVYEIGARISALHADPTRPVPGMELDWRVLRPTTEFYSEEDDENENSLVLLLTYGDVRFLFVGDIESDGEAALRDIVLPEGPHVLKVSHHGSDTSTSFPFLEWADPELAVLSVDKDGLHATTMANLGQYGVPYLTTYANGTICVSTDGNAVWVTTNPLLFYGADSTGD